MENISRNDISFRINKIKDRVSEINNQIIKNNKELENKYDFARKIGIKVDNVNDNSNVIEDLNKYIQKAEDILAQINDCNNEDIDETYKILNNILYLDDIRLSNIKELVDDDRENNIKQYINILTDKANALIREEEIKEIDKNIMKLSKSNNIIEKITGKSKMKKILLENYSLRKVETINKKYIPKNKSILEIVNIVNNCGYKSEALSQFIDSISKEYNLDKPADTALVAQNKEFKLPFFYNKELASKINNENVLMLDRINAKNKVTKNQEYNPYSDMLKNDILTLELLNYTNIVNEVE